MKSVVVIFMVLKPAEMEERYKYQRFTVGNSGSSWTVGMQE